MKKINKIKKTEPFIFLFFLTFLIIDFYQVL